MHEKHIVMMSSFEYTRYPKALTAGFFMMYLENCRFWFNSSWFCTHEIVGRFHIRLGSPTLISYNHTWNFGVSQQSRLELTFQCWCFSCLKRNNSSNSRPTGTWKVKHSTFIYLMNIFADRNVAVRTEEISLQFSARGWCVCCCFLHTYRPTN